MLFFLLFIAMAVLFIIIEIVLLNPLGRLIQDVGSIDQNVFIDTTKYEGKQEFFTLGSAINDMLERLNQSYKAVEETQISMKILTNILNGLDAYLYVSDPVTDEILFINDEMKTHFGICGEGVGGICWKLLQEGFTERCEFCPCNILNRGEKDIVVWEEHNTVTNRHYKNTDRLIDWTSEQKGHLQHSVDITDIKNAEFALQERFEQQTLMTEITKNFISKGDCELILEALKMTGEFMGIAELYFLCNTMQTMKCL